MDHSGDLRKRFWECLRRDDAQTLKHIFPTKDAIRSNSKDIWNPSNTKKRNKISDGCDLLDVISSIRTHINGGRPAIKCLMWLMQMNAFTFEELEWVIQRNIREANTYASTQDGYLVINTILCVSRVGSAKLEDVAVCLGMSCEQELRKLDYVLNRNNMFDARLLQSGEEEWRLVY